MSVGPSAIIVFFPVQCVADYSPRKLGIGEATLYRKINQFRDG